MRLKDFSPDFQVICMHTGDFRRAFDAFVKKASPRFAGN